MDEATLARLDERTSVLEWRADEENGCRFTVIEELPVEAIPAPWPKLRTGSKASDRLRNWVLPAIHKRLEAGLGEFLTELHPAVALFLRFGGIDFEEDPEAAAKLNSFVRWVQEVTARYEGNLLVLLFGDKGSYLYAAFGAPVAHEDDDRRAANAALELATPPPNSISSTACRSG
ncbi:MAG: hypothetical protein Q7O66_22580 [Dehalococcoidia bacterium]|nr:hypothetical protein [Dehalococcoidia bacterium]